MASRPRLILIDGYSLLFRAHMAYGSADSLRTRDGRPTGAVHGFSSMLLSILDRDRPEAIYVAWDAPGPTFRDALFDAYKATRPETDPDLKQQFGVVRRVVEAFGVPAAEAPGFEADDLIGTLTRIGLEGGYDVVIVTGDSDQLQLVEPGVVVRMTTRGVSETLDFDADKVHAKYGVGPERVADFKALVGDKSDNVPGVPGVGAVTAAKLLNAWGSLEEVLDHADDLPERTATERKVRDALRASRETARLALTLTTIRRDAPVAGAVVPYAPTPATWDAVRAVFADLEFRGLAGRLPRSEPPAGPTVSTEGHVPAPAPIAPLGPAASIPGHQAPQTASAAPAGSMERVSSATELARLVEQARRASVVGLALDVSDVEPRRWRGLAVALDQGARYYIAVNDAGAATGALIGEFEHACYAAAVADLADLLGDPSISRSAHHAKGMLSFVAARGARPGPFAFDTMIAAYLLDPGRGAVGLMDLVHDVLGEPGAEAHTRPDEAACRRAGLVARMTPVLGERLKTDGLDRVLRDMELPLIPVLVAMETAGVLVDRRWLAALSAEMGAKINETAEAIYTLAGERFVIGSTQQLQRILFDKLALPSGKRTKTGHTTAAGHLETLAEEHPIARLVLEHREASKLKGTYADALPRLVRPETGRIHTTLHQTVTATGRLASSDPNLQNVPVRSEAGRAIRRAFVAPEGKSLLSCDYSQIELRVFAHFTGDPEMRRAFDADEDIHTATATRLFGVAGDAVTPDMRRRAKTVNFAVIYGQSDFGLSQGLGIGMGEAREFIAQYFALFPGVKVWTASVLEEARARGYVATLLGRRRYLPDLTSTNRNVRQGAERAAVNMPIQGTAADIMKLAMIAVARDVEAGNRPWTPLLQVHDELLIETPTGALAEAATTVRALMEGAFRLDVRLRVDAKAGANWADMAPVAGAS